MAREPRWIVHRFGETLTVKVGGVLAPAQFRVPAALEPELRSWFRRRRLLGCFAALVIVAALLVAAARSWIDSDVPLFVALVGLATFWPFRNRSRSQPAARD